MISSACYADLKKEWKLELIDQSGRGLLVVKFDLLSILLLSLLFKINARLHAHESWRGFLILLFKIRGGSQFQNALCKTKLILQGNKTTQIIICSPHPP